MTYRGLVILGCGGHARSVADIALDLGIARLLFVDPLARDGESIAGFAVVADWPTNVAPDWAAFPALGAPSEREQAIGAARERGVAVATIVSRRAYVGYGAVVGAGALVAHGAHIGPFARVGEGAIVNTAALVDHESTIGDYAHVAVNATVAGRCHVGANSMIGAGGVVIDGVSVAADVTVGAGGVVVSDIARRGTYVGVPARRL